MRGYREYTGREPMRQISWTQSAVRNELIVKQFDPVWAQSVLIVLDTEYHGDFDRFGAQLEYLFSLTRTACDVLEQRRTAILSAVRREVIVFLSTRRDAKVDRALQKARALPGARLLTLFADPDAQAEEGRPAV